jgi:hypothetical protein
MDRGEVAGPRLLRLGELHGTGYIEFRLGAYAGDHWSPDSVYLTEPDFEVVLPVFERHRGNFNYYGDTSLSGPVCAAIAAELRAVAQASEGAATPADLRTSLQPAHLAELASQWGPSGFADGKYGLAATCRELADWLQAAAGTSGRVTVLGL